MRTISIKKILIEEKAKEDKSKESIGEFISEAEEINMQDDSSKKGENPRIVPLKLTVDEAKRAFSYQRTMLKYAIKQYKSAKGTDKEDAMYKLYLDAVRDYNDFVSEYHEELS